VAPLHLREAVGSALGGPRPASTALPTAASGQASFVDPERRRRLFGTPAYARRLPRGRGLRIGVLVWRFDVCGGVLVLADLVNRFVLAGHSVVIATLDDSGMDAAFTLYARPLVFRSAEALVEGLPELDIVVATFWPTAVEWVAALREGRPDTPVVYFLQDYEPWFAPPGQPELRTRIVDSYRLADARVVTSGWLRDKIAAHGHDAVVIPIGIDPRVFYPRDAATGSLGSGRTPGRRRILVQARPRAPWRGFKEALVVLERLARRRTDVEVVFFGSPDPELSIERIPFRYQNAGVIADRQEVARLYASCDLLFDPSTFQAFGLPGLEAMACGVPTVLPARGGIVEYAVHEENTLLVDPSDHDGRVSAIERVLDDRVLRARLVDQGLTTAARFTVDEMARRHLATYREHARR
jgi:glycosyltransferase involved in cell wall biosynthesis